jgi:hypothetical protein
LSDIFDQVSRSSRGDIFDSVAPTLRKKSAVMQGLDLAIAGAKYAGGTVVGAGEIAANLATQTYGLPARGYAELANLATGRTDLPEKVSKALIYEPQTEQGKAGMDAIGKAFDWWHEKSIAVGTPVQEAVSKVAGETAGNVAGATVASTMEAAPLLLGEVFGKAKGKIAERRAAKDQAIIRDTLAKEKAIQSESDLSRASLGDVIPEDPAVARTAREAATRKVGEDIFDRISRGYLGEEVAKPKAEVTPYDEFVMGRDISPADQLEKYGSDVYDRIRRGYLGDTVEEGAPKPFVAPQVQEYVGPRAPAPKELAPPLSPVEAATPPAPPLPTPITQEAIPTPPPAPESTVAPGMAPGSPEFYKAEAAKLSGDVRFVGDMGGRPMFQDEGGAGSFTKAPKETVQDALARARARYEAPKPTAESGPVAVPELATPESLVNLPKPWEEEPGQIARNVLGNERGSSPEVAGAARQIKEFFVPLSTMPQGKAYMSLRYKDLLGGLTRVDHIVGQLSDRFKGLSVSDKADVFNAIRGEIPMDTLPAELQTISKQTRADLDRTGQMLVRRGLLKKETFEANKDTYIHYLYLRHILPDSANIPVGKGGRLDLSYLKARKDLPESVRKELGLIEDVSVAAPVGMGKALGDVVKSDFFKKVAANPDWVWQPSKEIAKLTSELKAYKQIVDRGENVGPEVTAKYNQLKADLDAKSTAAGKAPADFVQLPDSPAYGEMKGAFVRKEIANDIVPIYSANIGDLEGLARVWSHVGRGFDVGMTMFKVGKVALNPPTMIRNVFSNFIQMNMSGIPIYRVPDVVIGGVKSMIAKDKLFRTLERNGGFKTNFSVAELGEVLKTFQRAKGGSADKFFGAVTDAAKYYGKIDDIAKMSLFKDAVTRQGMSVPDAVMYAQKWGMDYSLASRSVKHGRRYALPFLSYQYKIAPLIAETLVTRPWVIAKYAAIPYLMAKYAAEKYDWTDKDLDKAQQMMKEKTQGQGAYMILPIKDNKGNIEIVNMEYFLPWGNWMEAARDLKGGNFIDTAKQFGGLLGPYGNVISMLNTKREGEPPKDPFTGRPVYSKLDSPSDKFLKQTEWWWKLFGPSSFSSSGALGYTAKAIEGGKDKWGVEATGAKALGRWMGVNVGSLDPKSVMATRKFKIRELDAEIHKIYRDPKYSKEDRRDALRQLQIERKKILSPE